MQNNRKFFSSNSYQSIETVPTIGYEHFAVRSSFSSCAIEILKAIKIFLSSFSLSIWTITFKNFLLLSLEKPKKKIVFVFFVLLFYFVFLYSFKLSFLWIDSQHNVDSQYNINSQCYINSQYNTNSQYKIDSQYNINS